MFKLLKSVREAQDILNQLRGFQVPDKILRTGKKQATGTPFGSNATNASAVALSLFYGL